MLFSCQRGATSRRWNEFPKWCTQKRAFAMAVKRLLFAASLAASDYSISQAFVTPPMPTRSGVFLPRTTSRIQPPGTETSHRGCAVYRMSASTSLKELGLTPELERLTKMFRSCPNDKMRQMQLLHLAQMGEEKMDPGLMVESNKVLGCLSTVFVAAELKNGLVYYTSDSDAMITKGMARLLSVGLSGNTAEAIQKVKPEFIREAGLQASLTAGRNNGFLNMLRTMKAKALALGGEAALEAAVEEAAPAVGQEEQREGGTMTGRISEKLQQLEPLEFAIEDESGGEESKLYVKIVSKAFEGMPLLKRHRTVYGLIAEEMKVVHAVSLSTNTPEEAGL